MEFSEKTKRLMYLCMIDKKSKMSERVMSAVFYMVIRSCDIIDWWFPVKP